MRNELKNLTEEIFNESEIDQLSNAIKTLGRKFHKK